MLLGSYLEGFLFVCFLTTFINLFIHTNLLQRFFELLSQILVMLCIPIYLDQLQLHERLLLMSQSFLLDNNIFFEEVVGRGIRIQALIHVKQACYH